MTQTTTNPPIAIGLFAGELTLPAGQAATPPTSIKLTPRGKQTVRDGRTFDFDPDALATRFKADGIPVPIDTDHSTVLRGGRGDTPNTVGYVTSVEPRDDGLYGTPEWLDSGKAVLAARTHRFVSPSVQQDANTGKTTWLHSVALVSAPAIAMPALAATEVTAAAVASLGALATSLGLPVTADQAALLSAIADLRAGGVPRAVHDTALEQLAAANERLSAFTTEARKKDVDALLDGALKALKMMPFEREHYLALCSTEGGFQTVKTILEKRIPMLQPSGLGGMPGDGTPLGAAALANLATAHREEQARKGITISLAQAVRFVEANNRS